jgi:Zn-dependent protease
MNDTLYQAATLIVPLILAIVFHEVAHGWMARALGDPTAAEQDRLSLNPLRHVDPVGTVVVPGLLALVKAPILGWAKPVPVNRWRLRNPRYGMMAVAAAGPGSNFLLAGLAAIVLGFMIGTSSETGEVSAISRFIAQNLFNFILINVFLAVFNLLPIPPFDGSHLVEGLLPRRAAEHWQAAGRYGLLGVIVLIVVLPMLIPWFDPIGVLVRPPVEWMVGHYMTLAGLVSGR